MSYFVLVVKKFSLPITSGHNIKVYDDSGTEIDEEVFEDLLQNPNIGILKIVPDNENAGE